MVADPPGFWLDKNTVEDEVAAAGRGVRSAECGVRSGRSGSALLQKASRNSALCLSGEFGRTRFKAAVADLDGIAREDVEMVELCFPGQFNDFRRAFIERVTRHLAEREPVRSGENAAEIKVVGDCEIRRQLEREKPGRE